MVAGRPRDGLEIVVFWPTHRPGAAQLTELLTSLLQQELAGRVHRAARKAKSPSFQIPQDAHYWSAPVSLRAGDALRAAHVDVARSSVPKFLYKVHPSHSTISAMRRFPLPFATIMRASSRPA